jgi:hypothetical protein
MINACRGHCPQTPAPAIGERGQSPTHLSWNVKTYIWNFSEEERKLY